MVLPVEWLAAHGAAYLLGSLPTALWVTFWLTRRDVRELGDGNMGARNVSHVLGWWPAALVAVVDVCKGALAIYVARVLGQEGLALCTVGAVAVLGHDFPVFASFRGGQGMAVTVGASLMLLPLETLAGLAVFGLAYLILRHFNVSAALGLGTIPLLGWLRAQAAPFVLFPVLVLPTIPLKKWIDRHRAAGPVTPIPDNKQPHQPTG